MTHHPTAQTPEGHRIGAGMAEWLHGVGHGDLDESFEDSCPRCFGSGTEIICVDDMCRSSDECIHGDGNVACRECKGNGFIDDDDTVCVHGRDDYCRPCLVRERADERYLGDGGRFGWAARDELLGRLAE